jgi:hypothetical protein
MLLIYDDPTVWETMSAEETQGIMGEYFGYTEDLQRAGVYLAGDALQPGAVATVVKVRDGQSITTDGPFVETKEQLGGYYLVDVPSLDEALAWAAKIPSARIGSIEVRPVADSTVDAMTPRG